MRDGARPATLGLSRPFQAVMWGVQDEATALDGHRELAVNVSVSVWFGSRSGLSQAKVRPTSVGASGVTHGHDRMPFTRIDGLRCSRCWGG